MICNSNITIALCLPITDPVSNVRPLSHGEWTVLCRKLKSAGLAPKDLSDERAVFSLFQSRGPADRIKRLLDRTGFIEAKLQEWRSYGIWVMSRADKDYPGYLKHKLGNRCPILLFGCGPTELLNTGGIAIVGSRDASAENIALTAQLAETAAQNGETVISGGARGVDKTAMLTALDAGGKVVGALSHGLLDESLAPCYRSKFEAGELLLFSSVLPEARFTVSAAMERNGFIYCLANRAVAVCSASGRGGTWRGAMENLVNRWTPLWVGPDKGAKSGNPGLIRMGAKPLPMGE